MSARASGREGRRDGVEVPYARLDGDVLRRVLEELVTRDGTDYGGVEKTLEEKISELERRLERREAVLTYEAESGTTNVVSAAILPSAPSRATRPGAKGPSDG